LYLNIFNIHSKTIIYILKGVNVDQLISLISELIKSRERALVDASSNVVYL